MNTTVNVGRRWSFTSTDGITSTGTVAAALSDNLVVVTLDAGGWLEQGGRRRMWISKIVGCVDDLTDERWV